MNIENLEKGQARLTPEERRENAIRAGIASGEARRKRKLMRDTISSMMTVEINDENVRSALESAGFAPSVENAIAYSALLKACSGDIEAARFVRDTMGEKPTETFNLSAAATPIRAMDLSLLSDEELIALADQCD